MLIDLIIVLFVVSALYRGREIGLVRQLFAAAGFFSGLFIGGALQSHVVDGITNTSTRSLASISLTLGFALTFLLIGEYIGNHVKRKVLFKRFNRYDVSLGSIINVVSLLLSIWLFAAIVNALPMPAFKAELSSSRIIRSLNKLLPDAPNVIADIGKLIDPAGFPQVFIGNEPTPKNDVNLPDVGQLQAAVDKTRNSIVKIESQGCGGVVDGSGFIIGNGLVGTNAHVIAGIRQPYVQTREGVYKATVVYFNSNLDFAVLRVKNLTQPGLNLTQGKVADGTAGVVLGFPGGGPFSANAAVVLDSFVATGRNIYGQGITKRDVYELKADVIPGNSGGPLVDRNGTVIGVIFAESTSYEDVGYALTMPAVNEAIAKAKATNGSVSTGRCAR